MAVVVIIAGAALTYWRLHTPDSYMEWLATLPGSCVAALGTHFMARLCKRCGLSASRRSPAATRRTASRLTRLAHPKLLGTEVSA